MRFVFGWYSFKIKSYSPEDLKVNKEEWGNSTFEIRQKVFHLFWLPFFSIGKSYARRKGGKLYDVPESIITIIKAKGNVRTPWYSFLLPVLLITGLIGTGLFIYVGESIMKRNSYSRDKEQYEISINDVQKKLSTLSSNSCLRIVNLNRIERDKALFLKVIGIKDNTYRFVVIEAKIPHNENENYYLQRVIQDTLTFTKNDIQKAVCMEYDNFKEKKSCGFNFLGNSDKYIVDDIQYFDEPVIDGPIDWDFWQTIRRHQFQYSERFTGYKNDRSWNITFNLQNFGTPVDLVEIKNMEGKMQWLDSLPMHFNRYEYLKDISIQGSTKTDPATLKFKSVLVFRDSLNKKYEFILEGKKPFFTIKRK